MDFGGSVTEPTTRSTILADIFVDLHTAARANPLCFSVGNGFQLTIPLALTPLRNGGRGAERSVES